MTLLRGISGKPLAIFLMGPTASGKTDLAIDLLEKLPCELISVDSALIYRGMDIGTAKPDRETLEKAPHRLIDIIEPYDSYSVADFYQAALDAMHEICAAGKVPLLVGGTMMYFRILRDGIAKLPSADERVREKILADAEQHGWQYVHDQLREVDPESAERLHPNDPQRVQRALEVYRVTGRTMGEFWRYQNETGKESESVYTNNYEGAIPPIPYDIVNIAIAPAERKDLHERIALRFQNMLDAGFEQEVRGLYRSGKLDASMPSMRCVGYRQMWSYLEGEIDYTQMHERGVIATRQLAKRQLTWLRSWPDVHWLQTEDGNKLDKALNYIKEASS